MSIGLSAYSEEDDSATELAILPLRDQRWIVQVTPLERHLMTTEQLLSELQRGWQIHWRTLVWRSGMDDWLPIAAVEEFGLHAAEPPIPRNGRARPHRPRAFVASCLAAVLAMALTLDALRRGGAFDPGNGPAPAANGANTGAPHERILTEHRAALTAGAEQ